jgi:hypothetical protein
MTEPTSNITQQAWFIQNLENLKAIGGNGVLPIAQCRFSTPRGLTFFVMPGLLPGIHVFLAFCSKQDVDGRDKPGHDELILRK